MEENLSEYTEVNYSLARKKAEEVWVNLANRSIPVSMKAILQCMDVKVFAVDVPSELHSDGESYMDSAGRCVITYNRQSPLVRQKFTVAHEIGHIVLEHISYNGKSSKLSGKSQETEANAFAGALLIPSKDLKAFLKKGDKTLVDIASRYQVSTDTATIEVRHNKLLKKIQSQQI